MLLQAVTVLLTSIIAAQVGLASPTWDPPVIINPVSFGQKVGPIFDSLGNAWVVLSDHVNFMAYQSIGTSGAWNPPHIIGPDDGTVMDTVSLAVDQAGGFYVTYNTSQFPQNPHVLTWVKYTPATNWSLPMAILQETANFADTLSAIDSAGRLVIAYTPNSIVSSVGCNTTTMVCGNKQVVDPTLAFVPSVAANKSGSRVALVYVKHDLPAVRGVFYSFFDSATGSWPAPVLIPGSETALFENSGTNLSFLPTVVDSSGNVTLISETEPRRGLSSVGGFRYEGGKWTAKATLLPPTRYTADVGNGGSIALNGSGAVLAAVATGAFSDATATLCTFLYTPGQGWRTQLAAAVPSNTAGETAVAWLGSDQAAAVYPVNSLSLFQENAAFYNRGFWTDGPPPVPGQLADFRPGFATAPNGDALLVMDAVGPSGGIALGTTASWLRK